MYSCICVYVSFSVSMYMRIYVETHMQLYVHMHMYMYMCVTLYMSICAVGYAGPCCAYACLAGLLCHWHAESSFTIHLNASSVPASSMYWFLCMYVYMALSSTCTNAPQVSCLRCCLREPYADRGDCANVANTCSATTLRFLMVCCSSNTNQSQFSV